MLNHAIKVIWNRRRANLLVVIEIAAAFVVTFVLAAIAMDLWTNYRRPLGFDYENVWQVSVNQKDAGGFAFLGLSTDDVSGTVADVSSVLDSLPRTVTVEPIMVPPFMGIRWNDSLGADANSTILTNVNRATGEALKAIGVTLVEGRWFGPEDEGQDYRAVLVNRTFAERAFGPGESPVGRQINFPDPDYPYDQLPETQAREALREKRVVGVIDDFRQWGEFVESTPYAIQRYENEDARGANFNLLLKVSPGTEAGFEEDIISSVESVAPGWTAAVVPWAQIRASTHAETLLPLKVASTIAAFFLALVVMGLIGVLWQEVVRRTQEIGLRRALGANAATVRRQIQLETLIVSSLGILIGIVIAIQFPLLEILDAVDWSSAAPGIVLAGALILVLSVLGALYPSWLASRREPADALRYE